MAKENIHIHAPVQQVWNALTQPEQIKKYFLGTYASRDWREGSTIIFESEWEGKKYKNEGTILKSEPGKLVSYKLSKPMNSQEDTPEDSMIITYELSGDRESTSVTIKQQNIPDEEMKQQSEENWQRVLDNLKRMLEE